MERLASGSSKTRWLSCRLMSKPDQKEIKKKPLAFGVLPETHRYRLRMARYPALALTIANYVKEQTSAPEHRFDVLDVGVGRGRTLCFLEPSGVCDRLNMHGIDIKLRNFIHERERWDLRIGDVQTGLPYDDKSMDVIVFEQVLEHLHDTDTPLREIERVLKPGGILIIGVPTFPRPVASLRGFYVRNCAALHRRSGSDHHQSYSRGTIIRHLRKTTSLEIVEVRGFRVVSGGVIAFLEDYEWWYRTSLRLARMFPMLCTEVQIVARRPVKLPEPGSAWR